MEASDEENRKMFCGNLSPDVSEDILHELFLQAGPLEKISIPKDFQGYSRGFAFIIFKHECSVPYAIELFKDTSLYGRLLKLGPGNKSGNTNHYRSYSEPTNLNNHPPNSQISFDNLLAMSQTIAMGNIQPIPQTGPMNIPSPLPPFASQGFPNFQFGSSYQDSNRQFLYASSDERNANLDRGSLSRSSLQGNWSSRNDCNMLPSDDYRRQDHQRRSDREFSFRNDVERVDYRSRHHHSERNNYRGERPYGRNSYGGGQSGDRDRRGRDNERGGRDGSKSHSRDHRSRY